NCTGVSGVPSCFVAAFFAFTAFTAFTAFSVVAAVASVFGRFAGVDHVGVIFDNALQTRELGAIVQSDQGHTLCGPTHLADFAYPRAHQHTGVGDQHDLVVGMDQSGCHDLAIAFALLNGDHAFGATPVARVLADRRAFAKAVDGCGQDAGAGHVCIVALSLLTFGHQHGDHALRVFDHHAAHAPSIASH